MKIIKYIALLGVIAMTIALLNGFIYGSFIEDGKALLENPWGIVSMVDLYVGFTLFSLWIIHRESLLSHKIIWVVLMMVLGFFTASVYVFYVFHTSNNDMLKAIHGKNIPTKS
jgi:uncharacterized protein YneF (UPF0154 family)